MTVAPGAERLYAEDLEVGTVYRLGTYTVTQDEIVEFATKWDPQGFHIDEDVARAGAFGGIIASGIHSLAICQRLMVDTLFSNWEVIAGRSLDNLQMTSPVRPGMVLTGTVRIDRIEERGKGRALVFQTCTLAEGETLVLSSEVTVYVRTRA